MVRIYSTTSLRGGYSVKLAPAESWYRKLLSKLRPDSKGIIMFLLKAVIFFSILFFITNSALISFYSNKIYKSKTEIPSTQYGIVFGSAVTEDGESTKILEDRVLAAVDLYKAGKIQNILISGESRYANYSETKIMRDILIKNQVPEFVILEDGESGRTFDTCIRAKKVFNVNKAILITQEFHLPRALYLCNSLGIESEGYVSDKNIYDQYRIYVIREYFSFIKAMLDINFLRPYDYSSLN